MSSAGSDTESSSTMNPTIGTTRRRKGGVLDTRRAEQNRAAQRAFRQRKERYVKELENKVRDLQLVQERANKLEEENERLRQRVWELEKQQHHPQQGLMHHHHHHPSPPQPSLAPPAPITKTTHPHPMQTTHPSPPLSSAPPPTQSTSSQTPSPPPMMRHSPIPARTLPPPSSFTSREEQSSIRHVGHSDHYHHHPTAPAVGMEKGRVLDDLITILRTHHRPPIPTRLNDSPIGS